jgi:hypothetical protein
MFITAIPKNETKSSYRQKQNCNSRKLTRKELQIKTLPSKLSKLNCTVILLYQILYVYNFS